MGVIDVAEKLKIYGTICAESVEDKVDAIKRLLNTVSVLVYDHD